MHTLVIEHYIGRTPDTLINMRFLIIFF